MKTTYTSFLAVVPASVLAMKYITILTTIYLVLLGKPAFALPPANDAQASAIDLTQRNNWCSALAAYTNVGATNDGSTSPCGAPNNNVWFKFQATTPYLRLDIKTGSTEGTIQYPEIALWNSTNTAITCADNTGSTGDVYIETLALTIGEWYYVSVYTNYGGSSYQGTFSFIKSQNFEIIVFKFILSI